MDTNVTENLFTIKILKDCSNRWSAASDPFEETNVFHIKTNMTLTGICNVIAKTFVQLEHDQYAHDSDNIKTCEECLCKERTLYYSDNDYDYESCVGSKGFRDCLLKNNKLCIYQYGDNYWQRIYISVKEFKNPLLGVNITKEQIALLLIETIS